MSDKMVQVVFGSGPLGLAVADALVKSGKRVRIVNRSGTAEAGPDVEVARADANQVEEVEAICQDAEVVYQCAQPEYSAWIKLFPSLQTAILEGAARAGSRLVVGDNLYMYGDVNGPIHEDLPYRPNSRKGKVRAQMAEQIQDAHTAGKIQAAIVRGSDFYGPRVFSSSLGERVFLPLLKGKTASVIGKLDIPHSYTYIADFGSAMAVVGSDPTAFGDVWHAPTAPAWTQRQLVQKAFEIAGMPARISSTNAWMLRLGGLFIRAAGETVEMMYEFENPFILDSSKFTRSFHVDPTPHEVGLQQTVLWYQEFAAAAHPKLKSPYPVISGKELTRKR